MIILVISCMEYAHFLCKSLLVLVVLMPFSVASAPMHPLTDDEMAMVNGAGISVALNDFRFAMAPTSYFEQVGSTPLGSEACTGSGSSSSNTNCWRRGDLRWYGGNISSAIDGGSHWDGSDCDAGSLSCPRGGNIEWFSPFDNPYTMRAWSPKGIDYNGDPVNSDPSNPDKSIYEFLAPTQQPDYTFSFWGEIEAGATRNASIQALTQGMGTSNGGGLLKSQTLIRGNAAGSVFRLFQFTEPGRETFAMYYHSYLQGDFRFSVAQGSGGGGDAIGAPPVFDDSEGLHFRNVEAFLPLGQLYYQAFLLGPVGDSGDFYLELTRIPNQPAVLDKHYSLRSDDVRGYETARLALQNWNQPCADARCEQYRQTHGYVRYGDWYPASQSWGEPAGANREAIDSSEDGIFFKACDSCGIFQAFANRPVTIDKRGPAASMHKTQNYNCNGSGSCSVSSTNRSYGTSYYTIPLGPGGPVSNQGGNNDLYYNTRTANLGSSRIEGLMIQALRIESCQPGVC